MYADADAAAWYAAAADYSDDEYEEEVAAKEEGEAAATEDPYALAAEEDPYGDTGAALAVAADPYGDAGAEAGAEAAEALEATASHVAAAGGGVAAAAAVVAVGADAAAEAANPWEGQRRRHRRGSAAAAAAELAAPESSAEADPDVAAAALEPPRKVARTSEVPAPSSSPALPPEETPEPEAIEVPSDGEAPLLGELIEAPVPDLEEEEDGEGLPMQVQEEQPWDEKVIVVRQGQVHIELQRRSPPMHDATLLQFCDWLNEQLPLVVANFPYVRTSGAYVDLSDNVIGPEGLEQLFKVLRDHRVPCVVMKAYRNVLDDSIVDTIIEYLYTQPESFPMHGIHISHNSITEKGAFRLIRAAALCGHYPRYTSRLPLWLRLECNNITNPQKVVADCLQEEFNVCLMKDGLCSRVDCNHYSGVHVQLPYFYNQGNFRSTPMAPRAQSWQPLKPVINEATASPAPPTHPENQPDWMKTGPNVTDGLLVPKRFPAVRPAFQGGAPGALGMGHVPGRPTGPPSGHPAGCGGWSGGKGGSGWGNGKGCGGYGDKGGWQPWNAKGKGGDKSGGKGWGGADWQKGGGKDGKKSYQMWQGTALPNKRKAEVKFGEGETQLGFTWKLIGSGVPPQVVTVAPGSRVSEVTCPGDSLLRMNGLDAAMFTEKQVNDVLRQRPLALRFGDA